MNGWPGWGRQEAVIPAEGAVRQLRGRKCHDSTRAHAASGRPERTADGAGGVGVAAPAAAVGWSLAVPGRRRLLPSSFRCVSGCR